MICTHSYLHLVKVLFLVVLAVCGMPVDSAERGSSHYIGGLIGPFAGFLPQQPGVYYKNYILVYDAGAASGSPALGRSPTEIDGHATAMFNIFAAQWVTGKKLLGGDYAVAAAVPVASVSASVRNTATGDVRKEYNWGIADSIISPFILGYHRGYHHYMGAVLVYLPTGGYDRESIALLSQNYYTFDFDLGYTYYNPKSGDEVSIWTGFDFSTKNTATQYKSGNEWHLDWVLAKHLKPFWRFGLEGFAYQQVSDDTGRGAFLGGFRGRAYGIGPIIQYKMADNPKPVVFEFRYMREFGVENRLEGHIFWIDVVF